MSRWIGKLVLAFISVFAPIGPVVAATLVLVLCDLIAGVINSKKQGLAFCSSGVQRTVVKTAVYLVAIIAGFLTQTYLTGDMIPVCKLITSLIGVTELKSILEHLDEINGGSFFSVLIKRLGSKNVQD